MPAAQGTRLTVEIRKRGLDDPGVAEFLAANDAYLFQQPVWGRVLEALGHPVGYYCLEEDGRIRIAQPFLLMRIGFFRLLYGDMPYGFAVGDVSRYQEFAERLADAARRDGVHRIRLSRNTYDPDVAPPGWHVQEHFQHVLHFEGRSEEQLWADFKRRVRHDVRVAERRGVVVKDAAHQADRDIIYDMYYRTMARNRTYVVWPRELLERIWNLIVEPGNGEMILSWHRGEPLAAMVTFYSGRRCFAFLGASTGEKRNLRPNDALFWEAIRRAIARRCDDWDFMMSPATDTALIAFKDKWGAVRHPFRFYEKDLAPVACKAWNLAFRIARTRTGGALLRALRKLTG